MLENFAMAADCNKYEAFAAETVTDYLDSWDNVYIFFKRFSRCYDAAIAEGASDHIQQLWADHWGELPKMIGLTKKDPAFKAFVFERIKDESFPQDRFALVVKHASEQCPEEADEFCRSVITEAGRVTPHN